MPSARVREEHLTTETLRQRALDNRLECNLQNGGLNGCKLSTINLLNTVLMIMTPVVWQTFNMIKTGSFNFFYTLDKTELLEREPDCKIPQS
jgi:hypothetical protein